jgi:hypothetical protein
MNTDTVNWLVQEIHDLLDVSSVGLYEFMWMLNTPNQKLSIEERKALAKQALERLMSEPGVELNWMRWPEWASLGKVTLDELPPDPWNDPDDNGMYLALNRAE